MDVLVFGSANVDFICYVKRLPVKGETIHGYKFTTGFGGKGANQCVAAGKLGAKTAMVAKVGDDHWGSSYIENFKKQNVNVDYVNIIKDMTTGVAQINVSDDGSNQIVIVNGANDLLSNSDVQNCKFFENSKVLVCQLETPLEATIDAIKKFKGISIVNAAPGIENCPTELLTLSSIFCVNEVEAALVSHLKVENIDDAKKAVVKLIEMNCNTIIVTLGEKGVVYCDKEERKIFHLKARKIDKVVDTTGAGDAFIGALAYFLSIYPNEKLGQQIGAACEIASISVQRPGTQVSFPSASDLNLNDLIKNKYEFLEI